MKKLFLLALLPSLALAAPTIPAGSLDQVLRAWTLASGALLTADGRLTHGVDSPGLAELSAPERDLARILAGTGLEAVRQPDGSYLLRAAVPVAPVAPAPPMSEAEVQALDRLPEIVARAEPVAPYDAVSRFAVKGGAALRDTPQALTIIEASQIRDRNLLSMDDLLVYVPGVRPSLGEGNRDNAVFRGYNSSADFYLNGMRDDVQYFRDFYNIETVEVLKGPNAMALGRGGSGGAVNRVSKQAQWRDIGDADVLLGSWRQRRASVDVGAALNPQLAWRLNAVDEDSGSFRNDAWLKRYGVSPALAWRDGASTLVQASYEHFRDRRSTDRGVPSFGGRPVASDPSIFFGDPADSHNGVDIDSLTLRLEHQLAPTLQFSSQLHYAVYDKYYQNVFPGGMDDSATVRMLGYGTATHRSNLFYQASLDATVSTGSVQHRLSAGLELGRQRADSARTTGYFDTLGTDVRFVSVPVSQPTFNLPVSFRPSATDMAAASTAENAGLYLQDQLTLSPQWQVVAGLRAERLDVAFRDLRNNLQLASHDRPLSPRLGVIYRPLVRLSLYASYSKAYSLRVGEQMASLTVANQDLAPEVVRNQEIGARWDDGERLSASLAVYQLRRANVLVADAVNAGENQLVEGQRGQGAELELASRITRDWKLNAGYAWQRSRLTATQSATSQAGAQMPYVPRQSLSLWSTHTLAPGLDGALGVITRSSMFSSTSNLVQLPGYARLDASLYYQFNPRNRLQISVENLFDRGYYASSYNDNNISPGTPRALRIGLHSRF
ncbi:TonB-dependent siderophore receptor [Pseudoduganella sp. FT26W]|uniref:TonB-dependent siderophore receptor n=1 Tax=Duganella aquatilis TaxID=2666082 RepID=A0A844DAD7_9BURK|nr:TonB-dependent siderophore receptor [Duganella aquatilis]MRW84610.1 TonB-dependent siderophore receptor [Duganella aquatilis]